MFLRVLDKESVDVLCLVNSSGSSRCGMVLYLMVTGLEKVLDTLDWPSKDLLSTGLWGIVVESRVISNHFKDLINLGFKRLKYLGRALSAMECQIPKSPNFKDVPPDKLTDLRIENSTINLVLTMVVDVVRPRGCNTTIVKLFPS